MVDDHARRKGWRAVHPGVYALTHAPLTRHQRWTAATLTAPATFLSHASAACWGIRAFDASWETVTRPGSGGSRRFGDVLVSHSRTLTGNVTARDGIAITTAARTLIDLAPHLTVYALARAFRETLRLRVTTGPDVHAAISRHRGRRGIAALVDLACRYAHLPHFRTRSNAEARTLEILHDAGVEPPLVNGRIAGEEADLAWRRSRRIIEIDGPEYHRFPDEDARKQAVWESAGYAVRRIESGLIYDHPERLLALVPPNVRNTTL